MLLEKKLAEEKVNRALNCLSCKTEQLHKKDFSLHPLIAAHGSVSFPELQLDPEASAVHYQQRCPCEPTVCFTMQDVLITAWHIGEEDSP